MSADVSGFTSAPIKLAAIISDSRPRRAQQQQQVANPKEEAGERNGSRHFRSPSNRSRPLALSGGYSNKSIISKQISSTLSNNHISSRIRLCSSSQPARGNQSVASLLLMAALTLFGFLCCAHMSSQPILLSQANLLTTGPTMGSGRQQQHHQLRHRAHYMNINPSTHFRYNEGRQLHLVGGGAGQQVGARQALADRQEPMIAQGSSSSAHIYKRSSALISSSVGAHYPPIVSSMRPALNPLSRRMMSEGTLTRWTYPQMGAAPAAEQQQQQAAANNDEQQLSELLSMHLSGNHQQQQHQQQQQPDSSETSNFVGAQATQPPSQQVGGKALAAKRLEEAESLRQKQAIQYHDQWPSMAGKCHKRTLNFCASVLPFNTTTFPNIIGDTNRFEVKRSLPFFGFLAKSSCNKRLDELLCLLLEPPCGAQSGLAIPPCKKFCRLALEGCNEYIPATLAMSSVFDCRQYPDSNDPNVCVNLAQGSKCSQDEFKCPDKTCIPRNWLCDGVRDCIFAADEANCTELSGVGLQTTSVCSTEEFKCDGKCVPKAWKCDGERDCLDGSDEESCDQRPRCGPDRFRCADGNGCLPKRWVCDGKAECRDGSDEMNCEQLECSVNDFKCDNGICIPKMWRCDRQPDCKDGSDERNCIYAPPSPISLQPPASSTSEPPTTLANSSSISQPTALADVPEIVESLASSRTPSVAAEVADDSQSTRQQQQPAQREPYASEPQQTARLHLESNLNEDVSRVIQQESAATSLAPAGSNQSVLPAELPVSSRQQQSTGNADSPPAPQQAAAVAKELKKFDYDIIQSPPAPANQMGQLNELTLASSEQQQANSAQQQYHQQTMPTQIDFEPQQQHLTKQVSSPADSVSASANVTAPATPERVPIYRSLFKTLKAGQGQVSGGPVGNQHRYPAPGRRIRRERHQIMNNGQQQPIVTPATLAALEAEKHLSSPPGSQANAANKQPRRNLHYQQQQVVANYTAPISASSLRGHGVASYLQLLNSRYNLRLPRVQASQQ